jgi:hypothetical protein
MDVQPVKQLKTQRVKLAICQLGQKQVIRQEITDLGILIKGTENRRLHSTISCGSRSLSFFVLQGDSAHDAPFPDAALSSMSN